MSQQSLLLLAADAILLLHALVVLFVILALALVLAGGACGWAWVRNPFFRYAHLTLVLYVTLQAWAGEICPLTVWEMQLRARAGAATYEESFVGYWVGRLLYYDASPWVFAAVYTFFAGCVIAAWLWVRPRRLKHARDNDQRSGHEQG